MPNSIDPSAQISNSAIIGSNVSIGQNSVIGHHSIIGSNVSIGSNTLIGPNTIIGDNTTIGSCCVICYHSVISAIPDSAFNDYPVSGLLGCIIGDKVSILNAVVESGIQSVDDPDLLPTTIQNESSISFFSTIKSNAFVGSKSKIAQYAIIGENAHLDGQNFIGCHCIVGAGVHLEREVSGINAALFDSGFQYFSDPQKHCKTYSKYDSDFWGGKFYFGSATNMSFYQCHNFKRFLKHGNKNAKKA